MGRLIAYRMHAHQRGGVRRSLLLVLLAFLQLSSIGALGGCNAIGFYQQAVVGQLRLLNARENVDDLLATSELSPELRAALVDSQAVLRFAETQLGLKPMVATKAMWRSIAPLWFGTLWLLP